MDRAGIEVGGDPLGAACQTERVAQNPPAQIIQRFLLRLGRQIQGANKNSFPAIISKVLVHMPFDSRAQRAKPHL